MKGKLIVIEGSDGSGKKTQAELLFERAKKEGYKVELLSFPQYDKFFGKEVKAYLNGEFGNLNQVPVKFASLLYALDRHSVKNELISKLNSGINIITNRYMESNIGHQASKFENEERKKFIDWLYDLEIRHLGLPESDLVVYLNLPIEYSQKAMEKEGREKDIHEADIEYLKKVNQTYLEFAKNNQRWIVLDCLEDSMRIPINSLHEKIWEIIKGKMNN